MRHRMRLPMVILTTGITGMIVIVAGVTSAQTQQQLRQQQQQQQKQQQQKQQKAAAADAKNASDAEKAAAAKAASAKKGLAGLSESIKAAQKEVEEATKALRAQEDEIIDAQATDSAFGKLRDEFRAAEKNYQDARTSVVESDDFKAKLQAARNSDESATAVLALKKEFDAMPEIVNPRTKLQEVKERYEPPRTELLDADSKWVAADKVLKDKKTALGDLKHQYSEALVAAGKAKAAARKAAAAAAAQKAAQSGQQPNSRRRN